MDFEEFKNFFEERLVSNNIKLDVNYEIFYKYMKELLEWNSKINLTAIKDEKEFIVKHFIDSLTIVNLIGDGNKVIDVGTGAGFPGIPVKIASESLNITLVDSVNKKVNVLKDIIQKLNLTNIEAIHTRAEDLAQNEMYREKFDIATSRAVSNLTTLLEYLMPFVKVNGKIICMKGPNYLEEIENAQNAMNVLGGKIEQIISFKIDDELERNIIILKKIKNTPKKYPRNQGLPLKKPL